MLEVKSDDELIVSQEVFLEAPPEGRHPGVCVDVVPIGEEETEYNGVKKMQPKVVVVFQLFPEDGTRNKEGLPFQAEHKFTASLAPQAILRLKLEKWRGQDFTPAELDGFNLMKLKGAGAWVDILHNGNFANVTDILTYLDGAGNPIEPPKAEGYVRRAYKPRKAKANGNGASAAAQTSTPPASPAPNDKSDWVPF